MRAADLGSPAKVSTTTVKVTINRNFQDPRFDQSRYTANIEESVLIGSFVGHVTATDGDRKVCANIIIIHCYSRN